MVRRKIDISQLNVIGSIPLCTCQGFFKLFGFYPDVPQHVILRRSY